MLLITPNCYARLSSYDLIIKTVESARLPEGNPPSVLVNTLGSTFGSGP
jgi:hypothetical protein